MANPFKALMDSRDRARAKEAILTLLKQMPEQGLLVLSNGNMDDPTDLDAVRFAQIALDIIKTHPEYALQRWTNSFGIVRRRDLEKFASKETQEKTKEDGVLIDITNVDKAEGK
jgi:hypothetical protein